MAFEKNINDIKLLFLVLIGIPLIASTNIDCGGKSFHCLNSTHFMICVDLGGGVSYTVDDFVIPCPPPTVCKGTNHFECELPASTTAAPTTVQPDPIKDKETTTEEVIVDTLAWNTGPEQHLELSTTALLETTTDASVFPPLTVTTSNDTASETSAPSTATVTATDTIEIRTVSDVTFEVNNSATLSVTDEILTTTATADKPTTITVGIVSASTTSNISVKNGNTTSTKINGAEHINEILTTTESAFVDIVVSTTIQNEISQTTSDSVNLLVQDTSGSLLSERSISSTEAIVRTSSTTDNLTNDTTVEQNATVVANVKNNTSEIDPAISAIETASIPHISATESVIVSENNLNESLAMLPVTETILTNATEKNIDNIILINAAELGNFSDSSVTENISTTTGMTSSSIDTLLNPETAENTTHLESSTNITSSAETTNILLDSSSSSTDLVTSSEPAILIPDNGVSTETTITPTENNKTTQNTIEIVGKTQSTINIDFNQVDNNDTKIIAMNPPVFKNVIGNDIILNKTEEITKVTTIPTSTDSFSFGSLFNGNATTPESIYIETTDLYATKSDSIDGYASTNIRNNNDVVPSSASTSYSNADVNNEALNNAVTTNTIIFMVKENITPIDIDFSSNLVNQSENRPISELVKNNTEKAINTSTDNILSSPISSTIETTTTIQKATVNSTTEVSEIISEAIRTTIDTITTTTQAPTLTKHFYNNSNLLLQYNFTTEKQGPVTTTPFTTENVSTNLVQSAAAKRTEAEEEPKLINVTEITGSLKISEPTNVINHAQNDANEQIGLPKNYGIQTTPILDASTAKNVTARIGTLILTEQSVSNTTEQNGGDTPIDALTSTKQRIATATEQNSGVAPVDVLTKTEENVAATIEQNSVVEPDGITKIEQSISVSTEQNGEALQAEVLTRTEQNVTTATEENSRVAPVHFLTKTQQSITATKEQNGVAGPIEVLAITEQSVAATTEQKSGVPSVDVLNGMEQSVAITTEQNDADTLVDVLTITEGSIAFIKENNGTIKVQQHVINTTEQSISDAIEQNHGATPNEVLTITEQSVAATREHKDGAALVKIITITEQSVSDTTLLNAGVPTYTDQNDASSTTENGGAQPMSILANSEPSAASFTPQSIETGSADLRANLGQNVASSSVQNGGADPIGTLTKADLIGVPTSGAAADVFANMNKNANISIIQYIRTKPVAMSTNLEQKITTSAVQNIGTETTGAPVNSNQIVSTSAERRIETKQVDQTIASSTVQTGGPTADMLANSDKNITPSTVQTSGFEVDISILTDQSIASSVVQTGGAAADVSTNTDQSVASSTAQNLSTKPATVPGNFNQNEASTIGFKSEGAPTNSDQRVTTFSVQNIEAARVGKPDYLDQNVASFIVQNAADVTRVFTNSDQTLASSTTQNGAIKLASIPTNTDQTVSTSTVQNINVKTAATPASMDQSIASSTIQKVGAGLTSMLTNSNERKATSTIQNVGTEPTDMPTDAEQGVAFSTVQSDGTAAGITNTDQSATTSTIQNVEIENAGVPVKSKLNVASSTRPTVGAEADGVLTNSNQNVPSSTVRNGEAVTGMPTNSDQTLAFSTVENVGTVYLVQIGVASTVQNRGFEPADLPVNSDSSTAQNVGTEPVSVYAISNENAASSTIPNEGSKLANVSTNTNQSNNTFTTQNYEQKDFKTTLQNSETGATATQVNFEQSPTTTTAQYSQIGSTRSLVNSEQNITTSAAQQSETGVTGSFSDQKIFSERNITAITEQPDETNPAQRIQQSKIGATGSQVNSEKSNIVFTIQNRQTVSTKPNVHSEQISSTSAIQQKETGLIGPHGNSEQSIATATVQEGKNGLTETQEQPNSTKVYVAVNLGQNTTANTVENNNNDSKIPSLINVSKGRAIVSKNEDPVSTTLVKVTISNKLEGTFSTLTPSLLKTTTHDSKEATPAVPENTVVSEKSYIRTASGSPDQNIINVIKEITTVKNVLNGDSELTTTYAPKSDDNIHIVRLSGSAYTSTPEITLERNENSNLTLSSLAPEPTSFNFNNNKEVTNDVTQLNSVNFQGRDITSQVTTALPSLTMDDNESVVNPKDSLSGKKSSHSYNENLNKGADRASLLNDNKEYNVVISKKTPNIVKISDGSPQVNVENILAANNQDQHDKENVSSPGNIPISLSSTQITLEASTTYVEITQASNTSLSIETTTKNTAAATDKTTQANSENTNTTGDNSTAKSSSGSSASSQGNTSNESEFDCQSRPTGRYADNNDCSKFYICSGTPQTKVGLCPANTVFSEIRKQCTRNLSHCIRNNEFKCSSAGRFADYLKSNVYYICIKRDIKFLRYKLQCQKGYLLNKLTVTCYKNSQPSSQSISYDNSRSTTEKISQENVNKFSNDRKDFECEEEGKFADPHNCRGYYICKLKNKSEETYRRKYKKCDSDEIFHKEKRKCVDASSHECRYCDSSNPNVYYVRVTRRHHYLTYKLECQNGYYLNTARITCERKSKASNRSKPDDNSTSTSEKISQARKNNRKENRKSFECQEEGKFTDPNDCRRYYLCKENNTSERSEPRFRRKHKKCGKRKVFAEKEQECVYSRNNRCLVSVVTH